MGNNKLRVILSGFLFLTACSPSIQAPRLENPPPTSLNIEECKNTNLNFQNINAQNIRGIVNCLNGKDNKLKAYKDFLDTATTDDLNLVLDAFNLHMPWGSQRHKDFLDLIKVLHQKGFLQGLLNQVQILGDNKLIQESVKAALPLWEENSFYSPEPELMVLYNYLATQMDAGFYNDLLRSLKLFSSPSAHLAALALSYESAGGLKADRVTDIFANLILEMFANQSMVVLTKNLSQPSVIKTFYRSNLEERTGFENVFSYAASREENNYDYLSRAQLMIAAIEKPVTCFESKPGKRKAESLLKYLIDEIKSKNHEELNEFWLKKVPLLFASTQNLCSLPSYVIQNYDVVTDMVKAGHGKDYAQFWKLLIKNESFDILVASLKSPHYITAAPLINEVSKRKALKYFIQILSDELSDQDANTQALFFKQISDEKIQKSFSKVFERLFKAKNREQLKTFSVALANTWGDKRGGLGELLKISSEISDLSGKKPVQEFFSLIFKDQNLINKTSPPFIRLVKNPHFDQAVDLTAKLSGSGELAKLIVFFADLLRNGSPSDPGNLNVAQYSYQQSNIAQPVAPAPVVAPVYDYSIYDSCLKLKGSLFESTGQNLSQAALCLNAKNEQPQLIEVIEILKSKNLLADAAQVLSYLVLESPHTGNLLDQLEILLQKGLVSKLVKIYHLFSQSKALDHIDPLLFSILSHQNKEQLFLVLGGLLSRPEAPKAFQALVDVAVTEPKKFYQSQNQFRLKVKDPDGIKKQINQWFPQLSATEIENIYLNAKENFETHNDVWLYKEGSYKEQSLENFKKEFYGLLSDLLRSSSLKEFILAFQDYSKDKSAVEFVKYLSEWQMVTLNYKDDGSTYVRIQTGLDALENLVLNSDFGYVYMDHIGLSFQIAVVNSNDFVKTMQEQKKLVKLGHDVSQVFGPKSKHYKFKNMLGSFPVLELIAQNKQLRVLQRLYRAFYNATPSDYKEVQDTSNNYMHAIDRFNQMGFFYNLTLAIQQVTQSQQADHIINAVTQLALKIKPDDIIPLQQTIQIIVDQANQGQTGPIDKAIEAFWSLSKDQISYERFKTNLFHLALGQDYILPSLSPLVKALPQFIKAKNATRLIETIYDDLKSQNSTLFTVGSNAALLPVTKQNVLKKELQWLLDQKDINTVVQMFLDVYDQNPLLIELFVKELKTFVNSPEAISHKLGDTLSESADILKDLGPSLSHVWLNPQMRLKFIELIKHLSKDGGVKKLNISLSNSLQRAKLEEELHFLFAHFKKDTLKFKK